MSEVSDRAAACVPGSVSCFLSGQNRMSLLTLFGRVWETHRPEFGFPVDPMQIAWPSVTACAYMADDGCDRQSFCVSLSVLDRMPAASSRKAGPRSFPCLWIVDLGWSVLCSLYTISLVGLINISVID